MLAKADAANAEPRCIFVVQARQLPKQKQSLLVSQPVPEFRPPLFELFLSSSGVSGELLKREYNTQKYMRYLELSSGPPSAGIVFTIPRRGR